MENKSNQKLSYWFCLKIPVSLSAPAVLECMRLSFSHETSVEDRVDWFMVCCWTDARTPPQALHCLIYVQLLTLEMKHWGEWEGVKGIPPSPFPVSTMQKPRSGITKWHWLLFSRCSALSRSSSLWLMASCLDAQSLRFIPKDKYFF